MGTYSASKITTARKPHPCCRCGERIEPGARQLAYKQGLKSTLYLHLLCALQAGKRYWCAALMAEAHARIAAGGTCAEPCVGYHCCLPAGHPPAVDHHWLEDLAP